MAVGLIDEFLFNTPARRGDQNTTDTDEATSRRQRLLNVRFAGKGGGVLERPAAWMD
jgi:hypothetical protein